MRKTFTVLLAAATLAMPAMAVANGRSTQDVVNPACVAKLTRLNLVLAAFGLPQFDVQQTCTIKNK